MTAIWLLPFYPSPLKDDGYDIADYCGVHPSYGTLEDVVAFSMPRTRGLRRHHRAGDQPPRTSTLVPARAPGAEARRARLLCVGDDPNKYAARVIFTDTERRTGRGTAAQQFFWHRFFSHQPDLNFDNPAVLARCWTRCASAPLGVDGLRLDAIPYLVSARGRAARTSRDARRAEEAARRPRRGFPAGSFSPKRTSGRPTCVRISATATNATWRSIFP